MTNSPLAGKVAVVTGSGNGIGRAIAETFAKAGASVACVDLDQAQANAVAHNITQSGGRALALTCDVSGNLILRPPRRRRTKNLVRCACSSTPPL